MATETVVETVITAEEGDSINENEVNEAIRAAIVAAESAARGGEEPRLRIRGVKKRTC